MFRIIKSVKGQAVILITVGLIALFGLIGLAIDVGMAYGVKTKLNAAVDAAAIAAGRVIGQGPTIADQEAQRYFTVNYPQNLMGSVVTPQATNSQHCTILQPCTCSVASPCPGGKTSGNLTDGSWIITFTASAQVPTTFAKLVGWNSFTVRASATTTVRTLDMILVLDSSGSLNTPSSTPALLRSAAQNFINKNFDTTSDRVGLIHFAGGAVLDVGINDTKGFNKTTINTAIGNIAVSGSTTSEEAMRMAKAQLDGVSTTVRSSLRVIVFFSDGAPNGVAGVFANGPSGAADIYSETDNYCPCANCVNPLIGSSLTGNLKAIRMFANNQQDSSLGNFCNINILPSTDYLGTVSLSSYYNNSSRALTYSGTDIVNTRCNVNKAARNMLENVANAARSENGNNGADAIFVYTIGLGASLTSQEIGFCGYGNNESGEYILKRLANVTEVDTYNKNQPSGAYAYAANATDLDAAFQKIADIILRVAK